MENDSYTKIYIKRCEMCKKFTLTVHHCLNKNENAKSCSMCKSYKRMKGPQSHERFIYRCRPSRLQFTV